jgi:hypothetical protein
MLGGFLYVRATYGTTKDRRVREHFARAKDAGIPVGLYAFFRATQTVTDQIDVLDEVAELVDYGPGDLVPALDIEKDVSRVVEPWWSTPAQVLTQLMMAHWGECLIYMTQREWADMGKPHWVLERPLWVAHWTKDLEPATPGHRPWTMWQYRVGPFDPDTDNRKTEAKHPKALDHNMARQLLTIRHENERDTSPSTERPPQLPLELSDEDWLAMRAARDEDVRERG